MKKPFICFIALLSLMLAVGCSDSYDDSAVWESINELKERMSAMETVMNAYKNHLFITSVENIKNGYVITFSDGSKATITNGKDGADGINGKDGKDGADGINGKDGKDGADGKNGETLIESIVIGKDEVTFNLTDGTSFSIPLYSVLSITFDENDLVPVTPNSTRNIHYEIENTSLAIDIEVVSSADIKAKVIKDKGSDYRGIIEVKIGAAIDEYSKVVVFVSDGVKVVMKSISFEEEGLKIADNANKEIPEEGGELRLEFLTNVPCEAIIPEEAESWIVPVETRAMEKQVLLFDVKENTGAPRSAEITVRAIDGNLALVYTVRQKAGAEYMKRAIDIPDANFKAYLINGTDPNTNVKYDQNGDGEISYSEAEAIIKIDVCTDNIESLEGIETMKNLKYIRACGTWSVSRPFNGKLTSLDVSNNTALTYLVCGYNQLTSLDVSNNTALEYLDCFANQLTSLDVSNNTALTYLDCGYNQLTSLDVSNNTILTYLCCNSNQLTSLDVSNNTALQVLYCVDNQLTSLDISNNTALQVLYCYSNQLTSLDVSNNTALQHLHCRCNQLTSLDVSNNTALADLDCGRNQLTSLDVSNNTALRYLLRYLDCGRNQLTSLDVSNNTALEYLYCGDNQLTSLDVSNNINLTEFDATGNPDLKTIYVWDSFDIANPPADFHKDDTAEYKKKGDTNPNENMSFTANGVSFEMVRVEGGTFWMGAQSTSPDGQNYDPEAIDDKETPVHEVTLSDYYIGQTEVTQGLWEAVMGSWPETAPSSTYGKGADYPAYYVSWNDIQTFLSKLNSITGKTFLLPTEAQWEFAARGGTKSNGYKYSGSNTVGNIAWYYDNSSSSTHSVGTKQSNELGIYDMSGNVWEWCKDWYGNYGSSSQTNPQGPSSGSCRVLRGGSWCYNADCCRVALRNYGAPDGGSIYYGFRLALLP